METLVLPTYDDVVAAAKRIEGHAHKTPVLTSRTVNRELGAEVFFKCENYQRMGAFKFRGAFNALSKFDATQRKQGVVAFSSGNHAQGIALSAQLLGIPATIVMPHDARKILARHWRRRRKQHRLDPAHPFAPAQRGRQVG